MNDYVSSARAVLESMGGFNPNARFERREYTWKDTYFINPGASVADYQFYQNSGKNEQYQNIVFPLTSQSVYVTHLLITHNIKFTASDEKKQMQYQKYFLDNSWLEFKLEHLDIGGNFWLRDLVDYSFVMNPPSTAGVYLSKRDNLANYYPLRIPFIVGAGKQFVVKFHTAKDLTTAAYDADYTPYLPENPIGSGTLGTSNQGHSLALYMKGLLFSEGKAA